jgi:predicted ATPase/class 3 adenylate cyclase/Tfp pilus assembly protein PilF
MPDLPSGTVTFLFTDIEGSTRLLHELGDTYADALAEHRRVLRDAFARHGGVEVDTQGDAFFVAFARASDALAAARDAQTKLTGPVRVRMGLHTGEPIVTEEGYVGVDVHRAARIAAAGHGGQILVSQSTRDLAGSDELRDLSEHRLKDLTAPERIYQLGDERFAPLKSINRTNLPITASPLVGREAELSELLSLLRNGTRLVTVTGAGGSGKTRLALQVAAELVDDFHDSVYFVPLAAIQDPALVVPTIAQAAGVRELADLRDAEALLVVDNFEHLLSAANEVSDLLAAGSKLKLLTTSRVRLHLTGEHEFPLDPLPEGEAVELFVERARAVKRDLRLDDSVVEICRRLDGLPLALELAASRVKVLDPPLLLERLERRLPFLTGGARDAPERQQTLRATIEWSYALLEGDLQALFRRLSVFAGSFSLDDAEHVARADVDAIASLVDWSLLKSVGAGRFLILETIREYARELFEQSDEYDEVCSAHAELFVELAEKAERELVGPDQLSWYERLAEEQDNLRAALEFACEAQDGERALRIAGSLWRYWWNRGQLEEAERWYDRALRIGSTAPGDLRGRALLGASHMSEARGDSRRTRTLLEEAVELLREAGDSWRLVIALAHLASVQEDRDAMFDINQQALEIAQTAGDDRNVAMLTTNSGHYSLEFGDEDAAEAKFERALEISRRIGDTYMIGGTLDSMGEVALRRGDVERARACVREGIELLWSLRAAHSLVHAFVTAAAVALARGRVADAVRIGAASRTLCARHGFELEGGTAKLLDQTDKAARAALGAAFEAQLETGAALDLAGAVGVALEALT